ncbi:endopeptidase La [Treponema phagedenis]|uniref:Lon protease n=1 Tax=Treponema phagedenis TaxID=162 RepID=A0A0B7GSF2_TREPH|nr:endopeptidase La [Treponema phagedenis]QEJ98110.1 endopeptidase La [Treponema phagedenis]QEK00949.1 endopeptidase La [Treponema phagedenis]QEK03615.1 endopeptidase La [Treponema phagedenis]QEK05960.1 endopeptidase La [Treponema phagedenis]
MGKNIDVVEKDEKMLDDTVDQEINETSMGKDKTQEEKVVNEKDTPKKGKKKDKKDLVSIDELLPPKVHVISLTGRPIYPGIFTPILVNETDDIKSVEEAYNGSGFIGLNLIKEETQNPSISDLYEVGCVARIIKKINLPDGGLNIFISTLKRYRIRKTVNESKPMVAAVQYLDDEEENTIEVKALVRGLIGEMKELSENNPLFSEEMRLNMINIDHPGKIADFIASILNISKEDQQKILEILNVRKRMEEVLIYIKKEKDLLEVQRKIQNDLDKRIEKNQREYFLREELKSIKSELGLVTDPKQRDEDKFRKLIDSFHFEGEVKETVESEYERLCMTDPNSPEYTVSKNYLETILALPWNEPEKEEYDLKTAQKILDEDHYGLEDVKKRMIEYLAVRKLRGDTKGSIILFVGPPGVGKTSVGKSIARSMNKPFFRFSVGGMNDEAEIKGHRRTYIGALPGKILQGLKVVKTKAPVFMIDEVDKIGNSVRGDPASALLEVLDPEQNIAFRDHYLDLPFDLSNIMFILTANTTDTIPRPLLDRAEVIKLSGYIDTEKAEIAKRHLIPKTLKKNGLQKSQVRYNKSGLLYLINSYAREAGVRNLEKNLDKIHRKLATQLVLGERETKDVFVPTKENLESFLGKPVFRDDDIKKASTPGTAVGLAWTSLGGDTLLIEAISTQGKASFKLTGQMGNVMKESAVIAWSWVRSYTTEKQLVDPDWFEKHQVHLHIPEGATPKDGPSAGITMTVTLLSLLTQQTIKQNLAMTGELSLTGQVLAIGGLKEKTIAARRNGIKEIIIPHANLRDLEEIPDHIKKGISFHPVETMDEVVALTFAKQFVPMK